MTGSGSSCSGVVDVMSFAVDCLLRGRFTGTALVAPAGPPRPRFALPPLLLRPDGAVAAVAAEAAGMGSDARRRFSPRFPPRLDFVGVSAGRPRASLPSIIPP